MKPAHALIFTLCCASWSASSVTAQQFPAGFNCSKLTNDEMRAACKRQSGQSDSNYNSSVSFPIGFDCFKLTNEETRAACFSQQAPGGGSERVAPPQPRPRAPTPAIVPRPPTKTSEPSISSTGTGFFVSSSGYLISNAHVVEECKRIIARRANGEMLPINVVAIDTRNDLALLKSTVGNIYASFRKGPAPLGETIIVYGFPLAGTLAVSGNLTTGSISGLAGLGNDPSKYQVSAPVQPGNSGGAVLDESGLIVGVVQSKLNALRAEKITGDLPQNVNFAIKASVVQNFLEAQGVRYAEKPQVAQRKASAIADDAIRFTVLLACFQ